MSAEPEGGEDVNRNKENADWAALTYAEKNRRLFLRQKKMLDMFLERGAITKAQHDRSLHDLIEKTGISTDPPQQP